MKHKILFSAIFSLFFMNAKSQQACMNIGLNLATPGSGDYSENPFINQAMYQGEFSTTNSNPISSFTRDPDGYISNGIPKIISSLITKVRYSVSNNGRVKPGTYVFLYDGYGEFSFVNGTVSVLTSTLGRIVVSIPPSTTGFNMRIDSSSLAPNHARNFRLVPLAEENTFTTDVFRKNFLDKIAPFYAIRFMNSFKTNAHPNWDWNYRTQKNHYTQADSTGMAYEWAIELCNKTQKHPWVCVPHLANDNYIANMAALFRDSLNSNLKVYVEYSNEVWNGAFKQYHWIQNDTGPFKPTWWGSNPLFNPSNNVPENNALQFQRVFKIWRQVFGQDSDRVVRVLATFISLPFQSQKLVDIIGNQYDYLSPSWYFGIKPSQISSFTSASTVQDVIDTCRYNFRNRVYPALIDHENIAKVDGKNLIFYEGGQHISAGGDDNHPALTAFYAAQSTSNMYNLYNEVLDTLRKRNYPLAMAFKLGGGNSQFGSWGHIEDVDDTPSISSSPKYQALLDNLPINTPGCSIVSGVQSFVKGQNNLIECYPNPASASITILNAPENADVIICDANGKKVMTTTLESDGQPINVGGLNSGIYLMKITQQSGLSTVKKIVIIK